MLDTRTHERSRSGISLPAALMDGYLVHSAALARRLDVLLLPRQVLLARPTGGDAGVLSFVHGVPQASTVAGVTYAQDKRLRRTLLNMAGLPMPPGISFSSRGSKSLRKFILQNGYPLVLKEAIGENPSVKIDNISNDRELAAAISRMRIRSRDQFRPARSLVISAYAENILSSDEDELGNRVAPPSARMLIEKRVSGRYVRCLVCGDKVLAAIEINGSVPGQCVEIFDRLHEGFRTIALRTATVIPGLSVASVDVVVEDPTLPPDNQRYYLVELCERPRLDSFMAACAEVGPSLADALLRYQAERCSIQFPDPADEIAIRMRAENLSEPKILLPFFRDACSALSLTGWIELADPMEGIIESHIQGAPLAIASVIEALMSGVHFGQRAMAADVRQTTVGCQTDFRIA